MRWTRARSTPVALTSPDDLPSRTGPTSASISTSVTRSPNTTGHRIEPGTGVVRARRSALSSFGASTRPLPVISRTPISEVAPWRFLDVDR